MSFVFSTTDTTSTSSTALISPSGGAKCRNHAYYRPRFRHTDEFLRSLRLPSPVASVVNLHRRRLGSCKDMDAGGARQTGEAILRPGGMDIRPHRWREGRMDVYRHRRRPRITHISSAKAGSLPVLRDAAERKRTSSPSGRHPVPASLPICR